MTMTQTTCILFKAFNNIGHIIPRGTREKLDFLKTRKFNLCFENGSHSGYVTEKIVHAFYAKTIPIYWGSPTVMLDFNPNAFINRHDFNSDEQMISYINTIDNNDDLYDRIISQPILNPNNKFLDFDRFRLWFRENVYMGDR